MSDLPSGPIQFNVDGRGAYLEALDLYWPEMLAALRRDVYPLYTPPPGIAQLGPMLDAYIRVEHDPSMVSFRERLMYWAEHFHVRNPWLLDAALTTMYWASRMEQVSNCWDAWLYFAEGIPVFRPHLDSEIWVPQEHGGRESWEQFSARFTSDLARQLSEYRYAMSQRYGIASTQTRTHAHWTVLFQKGDSAVTIARSLSIRYTNPVETVKRAITRFASGIDLTLRTRRR